MSQIIRGPVSAAKEPTPILVKGSPIEAATEAVQSRVLEQSTALKMLGTKMGGGAFQEVKNIPQTPSAGGVNHADVFKNIMAVKTTLAEQTKYDDLGSAPARNVSVGGRRTKKVRTYNARHKSRGKSVRSRRKLGRVRTAKHRVRFSRR